MKEKWGKVLIIGDTMVDCYVNVELRGISPEALCYDVLPTGKREVYLGGAGNIYRQLVKLGTPCMLLTATGNRSSIMNDCVSPLYNSFDTKTYPIMRTMIGDRTLTTKIRFMSGNQQIFRVSDEETDYMEDKDIKPLITVAESIVDEFEVVLLVDYNKGMMLPKLIQSVIKVAIEKHIPVISDIKYKNTEYYCNSMIIKCNKKEFDAITYRPSAIYWIVTSGKAPTRLFQTRCSTIHKINTITNPYYKNANCAGDIFMAGFVNEFANNIDNLTKFPSWKSSLVVESIKAGNKLASKSLSKVKDKVV